MNKLFCERCQQKRCRMLMGRAQIDLLHHEIAGEVRNKARELSVAEILLFP